MSNDSNKLANDTAAFQVGDRVRFPLNTIAFSGTVRAIFERNPDGSGLLAVADGEENVYYVNARNLTLISRAPEPASAPAPTVDPIPAMEVAMPAALGEAWAEWREACYRENVPPAVALITLVHHAARRGANVAVDLLATGTPPQEGATR